MVPISHNLNKAWPTQARPLTRTIKQGRHKQGRYDFAPTNTDTEIDRCGVCTAYPLIYSHVLMDILTYIAKHSMWNPAFHFLFFLRCRVKKQEPMLSDSKNHTQNTGVFVNFHLFILPCITMDRSITVISLLSIH